MSIRYGNQKLKTWCETRAEVKSIECAKVQAQQNETGSKETDIQGEDK